MRKQWEAASNYNRISHSEHVCVGRELCVNVGPDVSSVALKHFYYLCLLAFFIFVFSGTSLTLSLFTQCGFGVRVWQSYLLMCDSQLFCPCKNLQEHSDTVCMKQILINLGHLACVWWQVGNFSHSFLQVTLFCQLAVFINGRHTWIIQSIHFINDGLRLWVVYWIIYSID